MALDHQDRGDEPDEEKDSDVDDESQRATLPQRQPLDADDRGAPPTTRAVATVADLPLDWTRLGAGAAEAVVVRYPHDVVVVEDLDPTELELCVVGTSGQKITHMGGDWSQLVSQPPLLKQLVLRSHLIRTMEGLEGFTELQLLELYDNQIEVLGCLDRGVNGAPGRTLTVLDMSYNVVRDMQPVELCPNLQELCTSWCLCVCVCACRSV
jgi:hypothetical protein